MKRLLIAAPLLLLFTACGAREAPEQKVEYESPNRVRLDSDDSAGYDADIDEVEINGRTCYLARSYESVALDCIEGE